jgi:DNA-binding MarR family transcriptional regulator
MTEPEPAQPDDRSEHWLVHLLWATSARTSMLGEAALAGSPLSFPGLGLLENVNAHPGIAIAEISRRSPQTQQALSQIAARLEKLGFIERRVEGGRGIGLYLTEDGARARARAHEAAEAFEASLVTALGAKRHQRLVQLLEEAEPVIRELEPQRRPPVPGTRAPSAE